MVTISRARLSTLASKASVGMDHPIRALLDDPELDELLAQAQFGVEPAVRRLSERAGRRLTKGDLKSARDRAERVGDDGEALAHLLLQRMVSVGDLSHIVWTSKDDAGASWDFMETGGQLIRFDAKSTTLRFDSPFHLSGAETAAASSAEIPYRIVRIYELTEDGAWAKLSEDINNLAASILKSTELLPKGVLPVGFTIDPNALKWGAPVRIDRPDEPEDGFIQPPQ